MWYIFFVLCCMSVCGMKMQSLFIVDKDYVWQVTLQIVKITLFIIQRSGLGESTNLLEIFWSNTVRCS